MKDGDPTKEVKTTPDTTEYSNAKPVNGPKIGKPDPDWKKFYTALGAFNTTVVLRAHENPESIPELIDNLVACAINDPCKSLGPGYVWDAPTQQCIRKEEY